MGYSKSGRLIGLKEGELYIVLLMFYIILSDVEAAPAPILLVLQRMSWVC